MACHSVDSDLLLLAKCFPSSYSQAHFRTNLTLLLQTADVSLKFALRIRIWNGEVVGNHVH